MASGGVPRPLAIIGVHGRAGAPAEKRGFLKLCWGLPSYLIFIFVFLFVAEDVEMKERRHQEVRNVH
jgi:hypothetical protein